MSFTIAYLADGKLFLARGGRAAEAIESKFIRGVEERRNTHRERHGWRERGGMMWDFGPGAMGGGLGGGGLGGGGVGGAGGMAGITPEMLAGMERPVQFTAVVAGGEPGTLLYALVNESVGGLFRYDIAAREEQRLVHKRGFELRDLTRHPVDGRLAASVRHANYSASLALMEPDGARLRELTGGDAVDESPSWVPGAPATLIYQSAGIGRDPHGGLVGLAPYVIHELDLERDQMTTRLELPGYDCLAPRMTADGTLFYIRRPYFLKPPVSAWKMVTDIALFPFRLVRAVVHFLNVFSMVFSRKPLLTAGGPQREGPDRRVLMLWGRWVEAEQQLGAAAADEKPLVPGDWQLVRRAANGAELVLASNVLAYDILADGRVVHTNGRGIFVRTPASGGEGGAAGLGEPERVASGAFVERVAALA